MQAFHLLLILPALLVTLVLTAGCGGSASKGAYVAPEEPEPLPAAYILTPANGKVTAVDREKLDIVSEIFVGGQPTDIAALDNNGVIYTVSPNNNTISVIDTVRLAKIFQIKGSFSDRIYSSGDGKIAYILAGGERSLSGLDVERHKVFNTIQLPSTCGGVELLEGTGRAFCSLPRKGSIAVIDLERSRIITTILADFSPRLAVYSEGSDYFYAGSAERPYIDVVSLSKLGVINRLMVSGLPGAVLETSFENASRFYVALPDADLVSVFDSETMRHMADIPCSLEPAAFVTAGNSGVVAVTSSIGQLAFLDQKTFKFLTSPINVGKGRPVVVSVPAHNSMVALDQTGTAYMLDLGSLRVVASIKAATPVGEDTVALDEENQWLYVGSADGPKVVVIDMETFKVITDIRLSAAPSKIIFIP